MESITLGDISGVMTFVASFLASGGAIWLFLRKQLGKTIETSLQPTNKRIEELSSHIEEVDLANCKNYLVQAISDIESGIDLDPVAKERFFENYDHYTHLGGNSYVKSAVEKLEKEGKI